MKAVMLFFAAAVALAYGNSLTLREIINEVHCLQNKTKKMEDFDEVFVKDLKNNKMDYCKDEFFCQAGKVLSKLKLPKCGDWNKLIRSLRSISNRVNCTIPEKRDEILLDYFFDHLLQCVQKVFREKL